MEFALLGPLRVVTAGTEVALPAKPRALLAALLLDANRVVPVDALIGALWADSPPPSARNTVQGHVKRLRRLLGAEASERVVTRDPGYLLRVAPGELDLDQFTGLCHRAAQATRAQDWSAASSLLARALRLWHGDPLADVPSVVLRQAEAPRLAELRVRALESRVAADLRLGHHGELIGELRQLTSAYPLQEEFWGQLMQALHRCGRRAEALEAYHQVRRVLRAELDTSPGPGLQRLQRLILAGQPAGSQPAAHVPATTELSVTRPAAAGNAGSRTPGGRGTGAVAAPAPAQLPADTADFTGRAAQATQLSGLLTGEPDTSRPGAVMIAVVAGMGGIGKTALAVHVAHRLRTRYPDGQLFATLRDAAGPLAPAAILARFLRDLGVTDASRPAGEAELAARYRTLLAGRRVLVVLDDARDAAQVRPLLPGSASCGVIITSRSTLPGLGGARTLELGVLIPGEAQQLLAAIAGPRRAAAEPAATAAVLSCCAGLPLAVRIAGSRLAARPGWPVRQLAVRLADERRLLAELTAGDLSVRASYNALPGRAAGAARLFRLLGLAGPGPVRLPAMAALAGQPDGEVSAALEILADARLVETCGADQVQLHDLLRRYAAELAGHTDSPAERDAALDRMAGWRAGRALPATRAFTPGGSLPGLALPVARAEPAARAGWLAGRAG